MLGKPFSIQPHRLCSVGQRRSALFGFGPHLRRFCLGGFVHRGSISLRGRNRRVLAFRFSKQRPGGPSDLFGLELRLVPRLVGFPTCLGSSSLRSRQHYPPLLLECSLLGGQFGFGHRKLSGLLVCLGQRLLGRSLRLGDVRLFGSRRLAASLHDLGALRFSPRDPLPGICLNLGRPRLELSASCVLSRRQRVCLGPQPLSLLGGQLDGTLPLSDLGVRSLDDSGGPSLRIHDPCGGLLFGFAQRCRPEREFLFPGGQRIPSVGLESGRLLGSGGNRRDSLGLCPITHLSRSMFRRCRLISETQHESLGFDALCLDGLAGLPSRGSHPLGFSLGRLKRVTSLYLRFVTHGARFVTGPVKFCGSFLAALHRLGCIGLGALAKFAHFGLDLASPSLHLGLEPRPLLDHRRLDGSTLLVGFSADPGRFALGAFHDFALALLGAALGLCDQSGGTLLGLGNHILRRSRHLGRMLLSLTTRLLRRSQPSLRFLHHSLRLTPRLSQLLLNLRPRLPGRDLSLSTKSRSLLPRTRRHPSRILLGLRHPGCNSLLDLGSTFFSFQLEGGNPLLGLGYRILRLAAGPLRLGLNGPHLTMGFGEVLLGLGGRRRGDCSRLGDVVGHLRGSGFSFDLDGLCSGLGCGDDLEKGIVGVLRIDRHRTHGFGSSFRLSHQLGGLLLGGSDGRLGLALGDGQFRVEFTLGSLEIAHHLITLGFKLLEMVLDPAQLCEMLLSLAPRLVAFALELRDPLQRCCSSTARCDVLGLLLDISCAPPCPLDNLLRLTPGLGQLLLGKGDIGARSAGGTGMEGFSIGSGGLEDPLGLGHHRRGALLRLRLDLTRFGAGSLDDAILGVKDGIHRLVH